MCTSHSNTGELPKSVPFNDLPIPRAQTIQQKMWARQSPKAVGMEPIISARLVHPVHEQDNPDDIRPTARQT
jgi:hypothetical protein